MKNIASGLATRGIVEVAFFSDVIIYQVIGIFLTCEGAAHDFGLVFQKLFVVPPRYTLNESFLVAQILYVCEE